MSGGEGTLIDMEAAALAVRRPYSTVRYWKQRGKLPVHGRRDGRWLVHLEDVIDLARDTTTTSASNVPTGPQDVPS